MPQAAPELAEEEVVVEVEAAPALRSQPAAAPEHSPRFADCSPRLRACLAPPEQVPAEQRSPWGAEPLPLHSEPSGRAPSAAEWARTALWARRARYERWAGAGSRVWTPDFSGR